MGHKKRDVGLNNLDNFAINMWSLQMKKYLTVISSFIVMLCLGSMFAWSVIARELANDFGFSLSKTQLVFGVFFTFFPITMLLAGKLERKTGPKLLVLISAALFTGGYLLSSLSGGSYPLILTGMGVLSGAGTGFGYLAALTVPARWFPQRKGLITGIVVAGFGLAAVFFSFFAEHLLNSGKSVLETLKIIGLSYGAIVTVMALFIYNPQGYGEEDRVKIDYSFLRTRAYVKLLIGFFMGTFAGLLVIGSLTAIGAQNNIENHILVLGVSGFALANFLGRILWGFLSDYIGSNLSVLLALTFQAISIFLIGHITLTPSLYLLFAALIGFGFGSNFVLFARETAQLFGLKNFGSIYPYVFLGYSLAGMLGPVTGGLLYDLLNDFSLPTAIAAGMSLIGALVANLFKKSQPV